MLGFTNRKARSKALKTFLWLFHFYFYFSPYPEPNLDVTPVDDLLVSKFCLEGKGSGRLFNFRLFATDAYIIRKAASKTQIIISPLRQIPDLCGKQAIFIGCIVIVKPTLSVLILWLVSPWCLCSRNVINAAKDGHADNCMVMRVKSKRQLATESH